MTRRPHAAPRFARWVLRAALHRDDRQYGLADADEEFERQVSAAGERVARHWYRSQARAAILPGLARRWACVIAVARPVNAGFQAGHVYRDVVYGLRGLKSEPTFALTAILTLALGIATITTTFSVADAELWKPLPYRNPSELVRVVSRGPGTDAPVDGLSGADLAEWRACPAFTDLAAVGNTARRVLRLETPTSAIVTEVTANYFATLGRTAIAGRVFDPEDAGSRVAVLTDHAWRQLFAEDRSVIGRTVLLDEEGVVIIGIASGDALIGTDPDIFLPFDERAPSFRDRAATVSYGAIGRLAPGVTRTHAQLQLQPIASRLAASFPEGRTGRTISVDELDDYFASSNARPLFYFLAVAIVVLILSAVNGASLLLGRAVRRVREFTLRRALGGGQWSLARQLLVEGALIAIPGGATGLLFAYWALRVFTAALPSDFLLRGAEVPIDLRVCAAVLALTTMTTMVFALVPMLLARRLNLSSALGSGGRSGRSAREGRARMVLLTAQIALTVILLSGAAIFMKSLVALTRVPLGFDPVGAVSVRTALSGPRYTTDAEILRFAGDLLSNARATVGVREAALATNSPLGSGPLVSFFVAGRPKPALNEAPYALLRAVGPGYFRTIGTPLVKGREFTSDDLMGASRVAIVNEHFARDVFPGEEALGKTIELLPTRARWSNRPGALVIVGICANIKDIGINEVSFSNVYVPFAQMPTTRIELIVRTAVPVSTLEAPLRRLTASIDPAIPVISVSTFDRRVADALQGDRFNSLLSLALAAVAVLLAAIGIYGAVAYAVDSRTREFGVRLAFGARPGRLIASTLGQALRVAAIGGALGLAATLGIARLLGNALYLVPGKHNGLLFGVTTTDPMMLACAFFVVVGVALAAGALPARRVTRVDPVVALRAE